METLVTSYSFSTQSGSASLDVYGNNFDIG